MLSSTRASRSSEFAGVDPGCAESFDSRVINCWVCFRESSSDNRRASRVWEFMIDFERGLEFLRDVTMGAVEVPLRRTSNLWSTHSLSLYPVKAIFEY